MLGKQGVTNGALFSQLNVFVCVCCVYWK